MARADAAGAKLGSLHPGGDGTKKGRSATTKIVAPRSLPHAPRGVDEPHAETHHPIADTRFRVLVGEAAWAELPVAVRRRFSKRLAPGDVALYRGEVIETSLSRAGRVLATLARLIGAPLPFADGATGPAVVAVTEDAAIGGQIWTRSYARPGRFHQVVHSAKRFRGPTGLEEYVGCGIGMTLTVVVEGDAEGRVESGALVFRCDRYFLEVGRHRITLPRWLEPGAMEIVHREEDASGRFSFRLTLRHKVLGRLVHQLALFEDA